MQDSIIKKEISLVEAMNRTLLERVSTHIHSKAMPLFYAQSSMHFSYPS